MKVKIEIPYYHGQDTAIERTANVVVKVKKKHMLKAIAKQVNGEVMDGLVIAGDGSRINVDFDSIKPDSMVHDEG